MPKSLIDTNIFLRLLLEDDSKLLEEAKKSVYGRPDNSCVLTAGVLAEILYVMRGLGFDRGQTTEAIMSLMEQEPFVYDEDYMERSLGLYSDCKLDFIDCYLINRAIETGEKLRTLDKQAKNTYIRLLRQ